MNRLFRHNLIGPRLRRCMTEKMVQTRTNATTMSKWRYHYSLFSQVEVGNPRAPFQLVCHTSYHPHAAMRANKGPRKCLTTQHRSTLVHLLPFGDIYLPLAFLQLFPSHEKRDWTKITWPTYLKLLRNLVRSPSLSGISFTPSQVLGVASFYSKPVRSIRSRHVSSWGWSYLKSAKSETPNFQLWG